MKKIKGFELISILVILLFSCSKKNNLQYTNIENLSQSQQQVENDIDEQLKKPYEAENNNTFSEPAYKFKPGKYNILDSPINIRSHPNLTSNIIGKLELHSEIEIIEKAENFQTIEGMTHYWYKIKYEDITGYIWGGFISISTDIFVLDNTKIYCYYRVSKLRGDDKSGWYKYDSLVTPNDIFIYINQKRIDITVIKKVYLEEWVHAANPEQFYVRYFWEFCNFYEKDGNIILNIGDHAASSCVFLINKHGEIIYEDCIVFWAG